MSAFDWMFKKEDGLEEFLKTLRREPTVQSKAMLDGIKFENMVEAYCEGHLPEESDPWFNGVKWVGNIVKGGAYQVALSMDITVDGIDFVVYGKLDFLKCGTIYDTKFSKTYHLNKYIDSPQHPFYFYICPSASDFVYLSCDGKYVYKERYEPWQCEPVDKMIHQFIAFLKEQNLLEIYKENWKSKY